MGEEPFVGPSAWLPGEKGSAGFRDCATTSFTLPRQDIVYTLILVSVRCTRLLDEGCANWVTVQSVARSVAESRAAHGDPIGAARWVATAPAAGLDPVDDEGMPWTHHLCQQRLRFITAAQTKTESFTALCRRFGISRPTGYKWLDRYHQEGCAGLTDRSRRPRAAPTKLLLKWRARVLACRRQFRTWGSQKVRAFLRQTHPRAALPSTRTIDRWLKCAHLSKPPAPRRRPGPSCPRPKLRTATRPNDVWTIDFKGWFRTADQQRCDPLTVRDLASRYLLGVHLVARLDEPSVRTVLTALFRRYGLPRSIRVDNGSPFAGQGAFGLSQLSVWWLRLGIHVDFTRPGKPQDNGAHEQMHRILKAETAAPPAPNKRAQQRRFARWVAIYNQVRPHESLADRPPAKHYRLSPRPFQPPPPARYPQAWLTRRVRSNGWIKWQGVLRFVGRPFVRQLLGLHLINDQVCHLYLDQLFIGSLHQADGHGSMRACSYIQPPAHAKL